MPVPFVFGAVPASGTAGAAPEQPEPLMPYEEQHQGPGEEPLPPECESFYETEEFERMESAWRRVYCLDDKLLEDTLSMRGLVRRMRELADELEGLSSQGYVLDLDAMDGDIITLVNPSLEREQWRLRRERRRAAMAQERRAAEVEVAADRRAAADVMDTEEGGGIMMPSPLLRQSPFLRAPATMPAAPKSPQAPWAAAAFELC